MNLTDRAKRALCSLTSVALAACALAAPGRALAQSAPPAETARPAEAAQPAQAVPPAEAARPAGAAPLRVDVQGIDGTLEGRRNPAWGVVIDDDDDGWRPICAMPCRRSLDPSFEYRVGGPGVSRTKPFRLPMGQTDLRLDVETGSRAGRVTGIVFIPVGATVMGVSLLGSLVSNSLGSDDETTRGFLIAAGFGAIMMTGGILLVRNNRTTVHAVVPGEPALRLASGLSLTPRGLVF